MTEMFNPTNPQDIRFVQGIWSGMGIKVLVWSLLCILLMHMVTTSFMSGA